MRLLWRDAEWRQKSVPLHYLSGPPVPLLVKAGSRGEAELWGVDQDPARSEGGRSDG